jgi:repressor LexA
MVPDWAVALRERRQSLDKSQAEVAREAALLNQTEVSRLERGMVHPTLGLGAAKLKALLKALEWSWSEFARATGLELDFTQGVESRTFSGPHPYTPGLGIPLLGTVSAGMKAVELYENPASRLLVDESFLPKGTRLDRLFALQVEGDSMVSEEITGIPPGAVVIAEQGRRPEPGDVVVVWVRCLGENYEGGVLKVWSDGEDGQVLKSWNPRGPVFRLLDCEEMRVQGIVRLVLTTPTVLRRK